MSTCGCGCGRTPKKAAHCKGHAPKPRTPLEERFALKVDVSNPDGCWLWTGTLSKGYGHIQNSHGQVVGAHRVAYELYVGPIPAGLHLDHLCRVPRCVRPEHLEPVTIRENSMRGQGCKILAHYANTCVRGHPRNAENTYTTKAGRYLCRVCMRLRKRWKREAA